MQKKTKKTAQVTRAQASSLVSRSAEQPGRLRTHGLLITSIQSVARIASSAGRASHRSPFTRKNMKPQKPKRLIQVLIANSLTPSNRAQEDLVGASLLRGRLQKCSHKDVDRPALYCKRRESQISQHRHLENLHLPKIRDCVSPF
jgi:hypothetical protein